MTCDKCRAIFEYEEIQISSTEAEGHHVCKGIELCPLHALTDELVHLLQLTFESYENPKAKSRPEYLRMDDLLRRVKKARTGAPTHDDGR